MRRGYVGEDFEMAAGECGPNFDRGANAAAIPTE